MIIKIANKNLKQPLEVAVSDEQWEELQNIENKEELNGRLAKIAMAHVAKYGYEMGYCETRKKQVTLRECMNCGVQKGWGSGKDNYSKWEVCKKEHIHYKFSPAEPLIRGIKDKKLEAKMLPQTKSEKVAENNTFATVENSSDEYQKNSDEFMKQIREKEDK